MCDPVTIGAITLALSSAQAVATHVGTNQAYAANEDAANLTFARETDALNRQQTQLDKERSESVLDTAISTLQAQGAIAASASSSGLSSGSLIRSINTSMFGIGRNATAEEINDRSRRQELATSRTDAELRRQGQINSAPRSSLLELGLNLGSSALQGYNSYSSAKKA